MNYSYDRRVVAAMKRIEDLPDDVVISVGPWGGGIAVTYVEKDDHGKDSRKPKGMLAAEPSDSSDCNYGYIVEQADATSGWGPLLYDVAMEYIYPKGLTSDRESLSAEAKGVWNYYLKSRGDVKKEPIVGRSCVSDRGEASNWVYYKKPRLLTKHRDKIVR